MQKIEGFVWKRGSFALQKPFLLSITTKRSCWHITIGDRKRGTILGRMEISRPLHRKAKILWQLENLQNYKDLYRKPLERDWRAKRLLLIQILLGNWSKLLYSSRTHLWGRRGGFQRHHLSSNITSNILLAFKFEFTQEYSASKSRHYQINKKSEV